MLSKCIIGAWNKDLDPVVQSIVSLTISLRHKFVKQISAKVKPSLDGVLLHICFCAYVLSIPSKLRFLLLCFSTSAKHTE